MVPDPAPDDSALPRRAADLPPGHPSPSRPEAASRGWLKWLAVAGLCLAIWGGLVLLWPWREKQRAREIVLEQFVWYDEGKGASAWEKSQGMFREVDGRMARALQILGTRRLTLAECPGITSVAALKDIATLKEVEFRGCTGLISVEGLPAGVLRLRLEECTGLTSVEGLPEGVEEINLRGCTGLTSVTGLPDGVQILDLSYCWGLTSVEGLPAGVRELNLSACTGLTSVADLPAGLTDLDLSYCRDLTSVAELPAGLQRLSLYHCTGLTSLGSLPPALKEVNLDNTPKLPEAVKEEIRALVKKNGGDVFE